MVRRIFLLMGLFAGSAFAKPVTAVLRLKQKISMDQLASDVQNPSSPRYGQFYSPEEIRNISAPSLAEYDQLLEQLKAQGLTIVAESSTHLWLTVRGEIPTFESTFSTKLLKFSGDLRRPMTVAQVPDQLSLVTAVIGLDNTRRSHPRYKITQPGLQPFDDIKRTGGIPQATIKSAYGFDSLYAQGLSGRGQHIAIATYLGFHANEVEQFYTDSQLTPGPTLDTVEFNGPATYDENSAGETQLDAEFSGMMAPAASIHVFTSATNDDAGETQMFTAILDDNRAKVVNYSWGDCETRLHSDHKDEMALIFARAVAQGVNILVASGDSGSDGCQDNTIAADWPAANPNVVAVGGTSFHIDGIQARETGWSGSGGGISALFDRPDWQKLLGTIFGKRSYPDVSFNADPSTGQAAYITNGGVARYVVLGGTSMAAPQWAGFLALVGEARANGKKSALGFLPPKLYSLSDERRSQFMNDVLEGSNGDFQAGPGWDAVTGFGSMKALALLGYLQK